jgi:hypothetical protein
MMKGLIENECGGQNPLMKLAGHFNNTSEQKLTQEAIKSLRAAAAVAVAHQSSNQINSDQLVNEYLNNHVIDANNNNTSAAVVGRRLPAPRTFQMGSLLNELKQIDKTSQLYQSTQSVSSSSNQQLANNNNNSISSSVSSNNLINNDWTQEYWSSLTAAFQKQQQQQPPQLLMDERSFKWSTDYLNQNEATLLFDEAWDSLLMKNNNTSNNSQENIMFNSTFGNNLLANLNGKTNDLILSTTPTSNQLNDEMRKTANELLDSMQDSRFSETEFLEFVRELSVNAAALNSSSSSNQQANTNEQKDNSTAAGDAASDVNVDDDLVSAWINEFQSLANGNKMGSNGTSATSADELDYWNELQNEWNMAAS